MNSANCEFPVSNGPEEKILQHRYGFLDMEQLIIIFKLLGKLMSLPWQPALSSPV